MSEMVIAVPESALSQPQLGKLRPVLWVDDDRRVTPVVNGEFPNEGLVFMPSNFGALTSDYPTNRSLVQVSVAVNEHPTMAEDDPHFAKYIVTSPSRESAWTGVPTWLLQHVVDHAFDPERRTMTLSFLPKHPLWVRDRAANAVFGPFDSSAFTNDDGSYTVNLKPSVRIPFSALPERPDFAVLRLPWGALTTHQMLDRTYAINTSDAIEQLAKFEWVDFIPDESILKWVRELVGGDEPNLTKRMADHIKAALRSTADGLGLFEVGRIDRAARMLDKVVEWDRQRTELMRAYLETPEGKAAIADHVANETPVFVDRVIHRRHPELLAQLGRLAGEIASEQARAEAIRQEIEELNASYDREALMKRRAEEEAQVKELTEQVAELRAELVAGEEIPDLRVLRDRYQSELESARAMKEGLAAATEELAAAHEVLRAEAQSDLNTLRANLARLKPYVDTLTGGTQMHEEHEALPLVTVDPRPPKSLRDLLEHTYERVLAQGHTIQRENLANTLTALFTSPLTVLAGLPGVGKTSLVTRVAAALGLAPRVQFLTVRVPRGWRTRNDVLGYHNPITGQYEEAPTGIYSLLRHQQAQTPAVPCWILFDEANLSPPEHYLSEWLGLMDDGSDRSIHSGRPKEVLTVPTGLRVVFTTNQDHTVELLSPRMLDRAAVVYVRPPDRIELQEPVAIPHEGTLTQNDLDELLQRAGRTLTASEEDTLHRLLEILHDPDPLFGIQTRVSPRKHQRVIVHVSVLRNMLDTSAGLSALDHAFATHVLPLVRGSGSAYGARLERLHRELENLPHSRTLTQQITNIGKDSFHEYSFQTIT